MILGSGIDIIDIARVERELERRGSDGFDDVLTPDEIEACKRLAHPVRGYAAGFAAKEACLKAIGTGKIGGMSWHDIVIARGAGADADADADAGADADADGDASVDAGAAPDAGRYTVALRGETADVARALGVTEILLSLAGARTQIVAYAVAVGRG
jgi:holo-[acyl-carrier protein] synthase